MSDWKRKTMSDLNMSHGKMPDFVLFPFFEFTLVIELGNFDFERHWNILIYFNKKKIWRRLEHVSRKNVWFCFISIVWIYFSHKTEQIWFWKSLKYFNISHHKNDIRLIWFKLRCLSSILSISWEIRILNFIKTI